MSSVSPHFADPVTPSLHYSITPFSQISRSFHESGVQSLVLSPVLVLDRFFRHALSESATPFLFLLEVQFFEVPRKAMRGGQ
jgi:hypothetical protein